MKRSADPGTSIWDYRKPSWAACPGCAGPARATTEDWGHRLSCIRCGLHREIRDARRPQWTGDGDDGRFSLPLYLTARIGAHRLWVYNAAHADALIDYLSADLRERAVDGPLRNKTMMSRLPPWMKAASARPRILRALIKLRDQAVREGLS